MYVALHCLFCTLSFNVLRNCSHFMGMGLCYQHTMLSHEDIWSKIKQIIHWHPKFWGLPCIHVMTVPKARLSTPGPALPNPWTVWTRDRCIPRWSHACSQQLQYIYYVILFFFSLALGLLSDCMAKDQNPIPENTSSFLPHLSHNLPYLHRLQTFLQNIIYFLCLSSAR